VGLAPEKEVVGLIGSKEGIAHLAMAVLNPGEIVLVGAPSYPAHFNGVILAGGEVYSVPLDPKNHWLTELEKGGLSKALLRKVPIMARV
jgi:LL-diaminopimelate aminotransferase